MITLEDLDFIRNILFAFLFIVGSYVLYFLYRENITLFKLKKSISNSDVEKNLFKKNQQDFFSKYHRKKNN